MRAQNITALRVTSSNRVADLKAGFPDQCNWVGRLAKPNAWIASFLKEIAYTGPVEMLTCDMCVLGGKASLAWSVDEIVRSAGKIEKMRKAMNQSANEQAHPIAVLSAALTH